VKLKPKFVRKAHAWCVTQFGDATMIKGKLKGNQKILWFGDEAEAQKFFNA
jgi:hypothetical protein